MGFYIGLFILTLGYFISFITMASRVEQQSAAFIAAFIAALIPTVLISVGTVMIWGGL